ncbi:hypothetical protein HDR60_03005 [bacterium]|nr:hypothetical protein [bacterium]
MAQKTVHEAVSGIEQAELDLVNRLLLKTDRKLDELFKSVQKDLQDKQDWMQFKDMPSPMFYTGSIVQYVGDGPEYKKGLFYVSSGAEWTPISVSDSIVTVDELPLWKHALDGVIYYVPSEPACYTKKSVEGKWYNITNSKSFEIVDKLPELEDAAQGIMYITASGTTATGYIKQKDGSGWYQLGAGSVHGFELVDKLPAWASAEANKMYVTPDGDSIIGYIKNPNEFNMFWQLGARPCPFEIVSKLPTWPTAKPDRVYFTHGDEDGELRGYIKDTNVQGSWHLFGQPKLKLYKYPGSEQYDPDAEYPEEAEELDLSGLMLKAFKDSDIARLYEEVEA